MTTTKKRTRKYKPDDRTMTENVIQALDAIGVNGVVGILYPSDGGPGKVFVYGINRREAQDAAITLTNVIAITPDNG